ncbi:MAG: SprT family zinc-dependent metalloprotease [Pseudomonadota bacterium]|nr:SprT family zinc-dependent metalloprotease [Pseudomonadota bacterium]
MKITLLTGKTFDIKEAVGMDIKVIQPVGLRKLILHIDNKEHIPVLSVPKYCSRKRAVNFVNENMDWILETLQKLPERKYFTDGETISLFGQNIIISHQPAARCGVRLENDILIVSGGTEFLHRRVKDFIRRTAEKEFYNRSVLLAARLGCKVNGVCIKDTKSRWGSCSSLNNINYNWRIALAPQYVIDYLIAHEVSHLKHQNHSPEFWHCVADLNNDWQKGRDWLQKNGRLLYTYF